MADRPFAYVCSPFRGDVEKNAEAREQAAASPKTKRDGPRKSRREEL
jgi:hypothetical protein